MSIVVREALSKALYELYKSHESKKLVQVPFVDKDGNCLPDEDVEYKDIKTCTQELLQAGASVLYYDVGNEYFLLPLLLNDINTRMWNGDIVPSELVDVLINSVSEKELQGLLPEHSNSLIQQMMYNPEQLERLFEKGLKFKQDIDNRYGNDAVEIKAVKNGNLWFFLTIAKNNTRLDFDIAYNKNSYNKTTLRSEVEKLKQTIAENIHLEKDDTDPEYNKNERRKETLEFLEKYMIKSKFENNQVNRDTTKVAKLKI